MKIITRRSDGSPSEVEFTDLEEIVAQVHSRMMNAGMDQGTALSILLGATPVSSVGDSDYAELDAVLADDEFLAYLAV